MYIGQAPFPRFSLNFSNSYLQKEEARKSLGIVHRMSKAQDSPFYKMLTRVFTNPNDSANLKSTEL